MIRFFAVIAIVVVASFQLYAQDEEIGEWSETVNGIKGRLITGYDSDFNGTKMLAVYLELRNVSNRSWEIYFDLDKSIESNVVDGVNKPVAEHPAPASIMAGTPPWLVLPFDSALRFRVSVSGYGVPKNGGTNVQMMSGNWVIKPSEEKRYSIEATFRSAPRKMDIGRSWQGEIELPKVLIPQ